MKLLLTITQCRPRSSLLDDVLSALDVHTARWVAEKCLSGPLLHGRTVILITHNLALTSKLAKNVVEVGSDGRITQRATIAEVLEDNPELSAEFAAEKEAIQKEDEIVDVSDEVPTKKDSENAGKLIAEEETAIGHVSMASSKHCTIFALVSFFQT